MTTNASNLPVPYAQALKLLGEATLWPSGLRLLPRPRPEPAEGTEALRFDGPEGRIDYLLCRPTRSARRPAVVVMLHGCGQAAADFARATRMGEKAAELGFHTVFPQQTAEDNPLRCWNWFDPAHQGQRGEPALLAAMIRDVIASQGLYGADVFVAGLSAGGVMAATLAQACPDLILAAGVHSGLPPGAARNFVQARTAMQTGAEPWQTPLPLIVFHGTADQMVNPANAAALTAGFEGGTTYHGTARGGLRWTMRKTAKGELWQVQGMGHDLSGGTGGERSADPSGPDASAEMLRFFREQRANRRNSS